MRNLNKKKFFFFYPHTLTFRLKRPVYRGFKCEGKCEGKFLPSHLRALTFTARAGAIRCRRFEAIVNKRYDFFDKEKMKGDFLAYFKRLADKKTPSGNTSICTSVPIIASIEYIAASQHIFAVSYKEALCIKTNDCTFAA